MPDIPLQIWPDNSAGVFEERAEVAMALGTAALGNTMVTTVLAPTGTDIGVYGIITIPQNYASTPLLVIRGVLAEAANTLAFGAQQFSAAHSESIDTAYEAEDTASNATWTGLAAEEVYEETITLTPGTAYVAGDEVPFFLYRDDSADTQTGEFHITSIHFRYTST